MMLGIKDRIPALACIQKIYFQVYLGALSLITRMTEQRFDIQNQIQKKGENQ